MTTATLSKLARAAALPVPARAELAQKIIDKFSARADWVLPLYFVALAARDRNGSGDSHALQLYLVPERTTEQALQRCLHDLDMEGAGRSVVCRGAMQVPRQFTYEQQYGDKWTACSIYHLGQDASGGMWPAVAGDVPRQAGGNHPRAFAMAATMVNATPGRALGVNLHVIRADDMDAAVETMRSAVVEAHPYAEVMSIGGRELALKPMGILRGPAGGLVYETKTPIRDPQTGLIVQVLSEVFY